MVLDSSFRGNGDLAIDVADDGPGVPPVSIASAVAESGALTVTGSVSGVEEQVTVQLFDNAACDSSGAGEAETLIDSFTLPAGTSEFARRIPVTLPEGTAITATATTEGTGEVSECRAQAGGQPDAPWGLAAQAVGASEVALGWSGRSGSVVYEIHRSSLNRPFVVYATSTSPAFRDTAVVANRTYLYKVRAYRDGFFSSFSAVDAATTIAFTGGIAAGMPVKANHITELRAAVNAMRGAAGLAAFAFADDPLSTGTMIRGSHVSQMRSALVEARSAIGLPPLSFEDATITPYVTMVKAAHLLQIRAGTE